MSVPGAFFTTYRRRLVDRFLFEHRHLLVGRVLDLGGGQTRGSFPSGKSLGWIVLDENEVLRPTIVGDAAKLPFGDATFDAVKCSELTGYLFEPIEMIREIARVLQPGGAAVITSPYLTPFDHQQHDGVRLTSAWWNWAAGAAGLQLVEVQPQGFLLTVVADIKRYWISHWWAPLRWASYVLLFPIYELLFWWEQHVEVPDFAKRFTTGFAIVLKKD